MSPRSAPTFLTIPVEIRKEIFYWAFIANCSEPSSNDPLGLSLSPGVNFNPSTQSQYGRWGREPMTRILRLNHQLYSEAIEVLFQNRFVFLCDPNIRSSAAYTKFLKTIGEKVERIQNITIQLNVSAEAISSSWKYQRHENRENLSCLLNTLKGVRNVLFMPTFTKGWGHRFDGSEFSKYKGDREILEERVMEMVYFFRRSEMRPVVQIEPVYYQRAGGSMDIIKACQQRLMDGPLKLETNMAVPNTIMSDWGFDPTV